MKVCYLKDIGKYVVTIPKIWSTQLYKINGEVFDKAFSEQKVFVDELPEIYSVRTSEITEKYFNELTQEFMTVEEYADKNMKISPILDEDGEEVFDDIDKEYAYKKFRAYTKPIKKEVITESKLDYTLCNTVLDSGNPFVIPIWSSSGENLEYATYRRAIALKDIFEKVCEKYEYKQHIQAQYSTDCPKGHYVSKDLEYLKIDGEYVMNIFPKGISSQCTLTFDKAIELYEQDKKVYSDLVEKWILSKKKLLTNKNVADILEPLKNILLDLSAFQPIRNQKLNTRFYKTRNDLKKVIETLESSLV